MKNKCCDFGKYTCQVLMPVGGRRVDIDICIADIVAALNAANIKTVASCCGHGKIDGDISFIDATIFLKDALGGEKVFQDGLKKVFDKNFEKLSKIKDFVDKCKDL